MNEKEFPYRLTEFIEKVNAKYDGDPDGDFVMAEDINKVQKALTRIENSLGIRKSNELPIEDRLEKLREYSPLNIDTVAHFSSLDNDNLEYVSSMLLKYNLIILNEYDSKTKSLTDKYSIYGRINASDTNLSELQNQINAWKNQGVYGIYLDNLNQGRRAQEISIVQSVQQEGLRLIVSGDIQRLTSSSSSTYNPSNEEIPFEVNTKFAIKDFGYAERADSDNYETKEIIMDSILPLVRRLKSKNYKIMGMARTPNRKSFNFVHTLGLMLGIDYLYTGIIGGSTLSRPPYSYDRNVTMGNWKTSNPVLFYENRKLYRNITNGRIEIDENNETSFPGLNVSSDEINWIANTVSGSSIREASIPPNRLSTYDIVKIVDLLNNSSESILIDSTKINSSGGGGDLPTNIGASHMIQNVIEAINKKNNSLSGETRRIENSAIKSLETSKLTGELTTEQLSKNIISALNTTSTTLNAPFPEYINIPYADISDIRGGGQATYTIFDGEIASFRNANVGEILTTTTINNTGALNSFSGDIKTLVSERITVSEIDGLDTLVVDNLQAGNIDTLIIDTIELDAVTGRIQNIIADSIQTDYISAKIIEAVTTFSVDTLGDRAKYDSLVADIFRADLANIRQINSGLINTDKINLVGPGGNMEIIGDTIKVKTNPDDAGASRVRILMGKLNEFTHKDNPNKPDEYGFMVLSDDGETQIFDHTGVYSAGIHDNAVINEKIAENAVDGGQIQHNAIMADHILAGTITADELAANSIIAEKIVSDAIDARHIHSLSIETRHLKGNIIEGNHLKGQIIEGRHIIAGSISTEHLKIGFEANLIKDGMDSFEQFNTGVQSLHELNTNVRTSIERLNVYQGEKNLRVSSEVNNAHLHLGNSILINKKVNEEGLEISNEYGFSAYIKSSIVANIRLGFMLSADGKPNKYVRSEVKNTTAYYKRLSYILKDTEDYTHLIPVVIFENSNDTIFMDALQVEVVPAGGEISPWRTTATTTISGDNITTGRIDSQYIQIGGGTLFGDGSIIELSEQGILVKAGIDKSVNIGANGIEVVGGAFTLEGGQGDQTITIDGDSGIVVGNLLSSIQLNAERGFSIFNIRNNRVVLDINPTTGNLRFSGTAEFLSENDETMTIDFYEQQIEIERQKAEEIKQSQKLETHQETLDAQEELLAQQKEDLRIEKLKIIEQQKEISKERMLRSMESSQRKLTLNLEMKVGYSSYNQVNRNYLYFHGNRLDETTYQYVEADVPGKVYIPGATTPVEITNQSLNLTNVPEDTLGYIIWDHTNKQLDFIYMKSEVDADSVVSQEWIRTKTYPGFEFNESVLVIGEVLRGD